MSFDDLIHKYMFKAGYYLKRPDVLKNNSYLWKNQWTSYAEQKAKQEKQLKKLINFSYQNIPYYTKLFEHLKIRPDSISTLEDLNKLPVLTKKNIKDNWEDFIPKNLDKMKYLNGSTGGSTGNTLQYRMHLKDYELGVSVTYRGWGYAGYKPGDKVAVIAGASLISNPKQNIVEKLQALFMNMHFYSSYGMNEEVFYNYYRSIKKNKPKFIRGYASSVYLFAKFIQRKNLSLNFKPSAVFTTSEKLMDKQRDLIKSVFNAEVFDGYGLNDGGISAYECNQHNGMHVDMERGILEVVDETNASIFNKQGKILATSLYNYAMPFIRYDTGDLGILSLDKCSCGRQMPLLKEISGRVTDFLNLNGTIIGSPVLTVLMGKFDIEQYQIYQKSKNEILIKIVSGEKYNKEKDESYIKQSFYSHVGKIKITFDYKSFNNTSFLNKHKFIINET